MPDPTPEPIDTTAPRLIGVMVSVISALRARSVLVETNEVFLLDQSDVRYEVPHALNGIPVQMNFVGSIPPYSDRIWYHLHVYVVGTRRWAMREPIRGFNVPLITARIMKQLADLKQARDERERVARDEELAKSRLAAMGATLRLFQETPLCLQQDNLIIEALLDSPDEVQITVRTSHEKAQQIAREHRIVRRGRPRKLRTDV